MSYLLVESKEVGSNEAYVTVSHQHITHKYSSLVNALNKPCTYSIYLGALTLLWKMEADGGETGEEEIGKKRL